MCVVGILLVLVGCACGRLGCMCCCFVYQSLFTTCSMGPKKEEIA